MVQNYKHAKFHSQKSPFFFNFETYPNEEKKSLDFQSHKVHVENKHITDFNNSEVEIKLKPQFQSAIKLFSFWQNFSVKTACNIIYSFGLSKLFKSSTNIF